MTFGGQVLRVLGDADRTLLIMVDANGAKLQIKSHWFGSDKKPIGGGAVTLTGTVTRVGESSNEDAVPVSIAVEGYTTSR